MVLEKKTSYKKIPIPSPITKKPQRKKIDLYICKNNENTYNPHSKIIIVNKNSKSIISNPNYQFSSSNNINNKEFKENIHSNLTNKYKSLMENNKIIIPFSREIHKKVSINSQINKRIMNEDILPKKLNDKSIGQYKYLENFDKYKKIKNNNDMNRNQYNKEGNKNNNDNGNNIIKRKINQKYYSNLRKDDINRKDENRINYNYKQSSYLNNKNINFNNV